MKIKYLFFLFASIAGFSSCEESDTIEPETPAVANTEQYHYELPVIFHVLYKDKSDPLQYMASSRLAKILDAANQRYKGVPGSSENMNLTFTAATTDPQGKTLPDPGVEYIQWPESYPIDCVEFMNDDYSKGGKGYVKYIWDPNKYVNVMVYNFAEEPGSNEVILGISHFPYSVKGDHPLEGLAEVGSSYIKLENLNYPHSISINSKFIYAPLLTYDPDDISNTLSHEFGHYLGLFHVFSETDDDNKPCEDTDFCQDTPSYNRDLYMSNQDYIMNYERDKFTFDFLTKRESCNGSQFTSHNIMDYSFGYSDQFTQDQRKRIRHVLSYSPLIPGPKGRRTATRANAPEGVLDLPMRTAK